MFTANKNVTTLKQVTQFVPNLDYIDLACLLKVTAESIRVGQTLADTLEELNVDIEGVTDGGCGLLSYVQDVSEETDLINLATFCCAHLMQAYRCI